MYKVTLSIPCWRRPLRTRRAIECIMSQDLQGWEALVIGDGCPDFQNLIDSGYLLEQAAIAEKNGNSLVFRNLEKNYGGCGYHITNCNIQAAQGDYILFMGNDDIIKPNHFSHYYNAIKDSKLDYMYFDSFLHPTNQIRKSKLAPSEIGHSEIIVSKNLAKKAPPHTGKYGHDWDFLRFIIDNGKGKKSISTETTYEIRSIPNFGTRDRID